LGHAVRVVTAAVLVGLYALTEPITVAEGVGNQLVLHRPNHDQRLLDAAAVAPADTKPLTFSLGCEVRLNGPAQRTGTSGRARMTGSGQDETTRSLAPLDRHRGQVAARRMDCLGALPREDSWSSRPCSTRARRMSSAHRALSASVGRSPGVSLGAP